MINILAVLIFFASFAQILYNVIPTIINKNLIDFLVYWQAWDRFIKGENIYKFLYSLPLDRIPFNYPPSTLVFFSPFKTLPLHFSEILLTIISLSSLWLSLHVVLKITRIKLPFSLLLMIFAFLNQTFPVKFTLILGQINLIVLGLVMIAIYLYLIRKDRFYFFSILLFSIAACLKIIPLLTLPLFIIVGDYFYAGSVLAIFVFSNLLASTGLTWRYVSMVLPSIAKISQPSFYDQSIISALLRLGISVNIAKAASFSLITLLLFVIFYKLKNSGFSKDLFFRYFLVILAISSIGNFFSWQHHLVFAYPLAFYLFLIFWKNKKTSYLFGFIFIWFLFFFHFKNQSEQLLKNPMIASYQTITVLFLIFAGLSIGYNSRHGAGKKDSHSIRLDR